MLRLYLTAVCSLLLPQPGNLTMPRNGEPLSHADISAMRRGPLPDWLLAVEPPLTHTAVLCYARLLRRANGEGRAWPKQSTLARELRCSERYVRELIQQFAEMGVLRIERRPGTRQNEYVLTYHEALMTRSLDDADTGTTVPVSSAAHRNSSSGIESAKPEPQFLLNRNPSSGIGADTGTPVPVRPEPQFLLNRNPSSGSSMKSTKEEYQGSNRRLCHDSDKNHGTAAEVGGVVAKLRKAGVHQEIAERLLQRFPGAIEKASRWADWLPTVRRGMEAEGKPLEDDEAYLGYHLSGRCHQHETRPCVDPLCDTPRHVLKARPSTVAVRPAAVSTAAKGPGTQVDPAAAEIWAHLLDVAGLHTDMLRTAAAVRLDGKSLVVELAGLNADYLRPRTAKLLDLVRASGAKVDSLRFVPTNGGRSNG